MSVKTGGSEHITFKEYHFTMLNSTHFGKTKKLSIIIGLSTLIMAGLSACSLNSTYRTTSNSQLVIYLYDSPALYDAVTLNIKQIEAYRADNSPAWVTLADQAGNKSFNINLLALADDNPYPVGASGLTAGTYTKLRLTLNTGSTIQVNGKQYNLAIDTTTAQSGINLGINSTVNSQTNAAIVLDFDVSRSVHVNSSDSTFTFKPVVSVVDVATAGGITGSVSPQVAQPVVYLTNGIDTVASTYATIALGQFQFIAVPVGTYDLAVHPLAGNYKDTTLSNIQVTMGQVTQLSTINLSLK